MTQIGKPSQIGPEQAPRGRFGSLVPRLARVGITPNMVSVGGLLAGVGAAACLTMGAGHVLPWERSAGAPASWWPVLAGVFLGVAALADLLDGDLARRGGMQTRFGALFDSTLDRIGDIAIFVGCTLYFAARANVTWVLICSLALSGAVLISYVKARGENLVEGLGVGFWQRGERIATLLCGAFLGHMPAAIGLLAVFQVFTVWRRMAEAHRRIEPASSLPELPAVISRLAPWRKRRSSPAYAALCLGIAVTVLVSPWLWPSLLGLSDPLGDWLASPTAR